MTAIAGEQPEEASSKCRRCKSRAEISTSSFLNVLNWNPSHSQSSVESIIRVVISQRFAWVILRATWRESHSSCFDSDYVGSQSCGECHTNIYFKWQAASPMRTRSLGRRRTERHRHAVSLDDRVALLPGGRGLHAGVVRQARHLKSGTQWIQVFSSLNKCQEYNQNQTLFHPTPPKWKYRLFSVIIK